MATKLWHTIVFVLGYCQDAKHNDWRLVCWGDVENGLLGRVPEAIKTARRVGADVIVWSGGPEISGRAPPLKECEALFRLAVFADLLRDFPGEPWLELFPGGEDEFNIWIRDTKMLDLESLHTRGSMIFLREYVRWINPYPPYGVLVYLVTSANHDPRAGVELSLVFEARSPGKYDLCTAKAQTCYAGGTVEHVKVDDGVIKNPFVRWWKFFRSRMRPLD